MPRNIPAAWIHHIELTLWDPAYPNMGHKRIFRSDTDPIPGRLEFVSDMWDGKLYENGVSGTAYYTQASDFFMQAIVYWRPAYPVPGCTEGGSHVHSAACWKPWENGNYESSDEFQEDRYAIVVEDYDWFNRGTQYSFPLTHSGDTILICPRSRTFLPGLPFWRSRPIGPFPSFEYTAFV